MLFLRRLKTQVIHLIGWGMLPFSLLFFTLSFLLFHLGALRRAKVLILPEKLNFSGTVWVPDYARHRFPGEHLVFLTFRERFHNSGIPVIWHDIEDVEPIFLSRYGLDFHLLGRHVIIPDRQIFDPAARWVITRMARWLGRNPILLNYVKIYSEVKIPEAIRKDLDDMLARDPETPWADLWPGFLEFCMYFYLRRTVSLKPPSLPPNLRDEVDRVLARARRGRGEGRLCGFYLKNAVNNLDEEPHQFDGGPFETYLPAIRFLVSRGYQILLTGDRPLPKQAAEEFDGMLVDSELLGLNRNFYRLFVALHTDIFVGDMAGGTFLAGMVPNRPMLGLNTFHFVSAFCDHWIYYKHAYDHDGVHLSYADMIGKYAFDGEPEEFTIEVNSEDEILEAVQSYVEEMERPGSSLIDVTLEDMWPSFTGFKLGNCHISPAYVRNYYLRTAATSASRPLNKAS